jgi:hypothetical protein
VSYQPIPVKAFGGLNLSADPAEVSVSEFVTGYNFDTKDPGRIRSRDGYTGYQAWTTITFMRRFGQYMFASSPDVNASYRVDTATGTATSLASGASTDNSYDFASDGVSGYVYSINPARTLRRVLPGSGTLGSPLASTPSGTLLATTPLSDRLVAAGQTDPHKLSFSAAGDGTTWGATDYLDLTPGDGGAIRAMCVFSNDLYVFKNDKFFVFTGESTDSVGGAVFNYRTVDVGKGAVNTAAAVGSPLGVFFVAKDGVYVTDGGAPQKISSAIDPLFNTAMATDFDYNALSVGQIYMAYHQGRLYINFGATATHEIGGTTTRTLVYDPETRAWHYWKFAEDVYAMLGDVPQVGSATLTQLVIAGASAVYKQRGGESTDSATAITSRVVSGSSDFGLDGYKVIREVEVRGSGSPSLGLFTDRDYTTGTTAVTLNAERRGKYRTARKGENFAWSVTGTAAWSLDSLTLQLRDRRAVGVGDVN